MGILPKKIVIRKSVFFFVGYFFFFFLRSSNENCFRRLTAIVNVTFREEYFGIDGKSVSGGNRCPRARSRMIHIIVRSIL